ncbi:Hypothetical predicted protein [Lecanosticta acicola]|uniref:Uncharacterized protein n=1 Tax=Lecanosticta acicola TaxID=111012 RepID=A0AAI8W2K0_9PEZI|nr:Hypothetical predicted protein [Lecanosticta acicola]
MGHHFSLTSLLISTLAFNAGARHIHPYKHEAVQIARRQVGPPISATPTDMAAATTSPAILTYITPSPGASPVAITEQSQLVESFVAEYTICELPPQALIPITPVPSTLATTARYHNYSISIPPGTGSCTTIYIPTQTMVCATTLTALVEKVTVTNCAQDITFSSEYGYVLASPTAASNYSGVASAGTAMITPKPTVQRLTTYFIAPWEDVTAGTAPSDVRLKVCAKYANGTNECIEQYEVWQTSLVTRTATTTTSVNISTTIHGPSQVIVETFAANITNQISTFQMSTDMVLEYQTEIETTSRSSVTPTTAPTSYMTVTVENASDGVPDSTTTRTSTIRRTSTTTVFVGTSTATLPDDLLTAASAAASALETALPTSTESVDFLVLRKNKETVTQMQVLCAKRRPLANAAVMRQTSYQAQQLPAFAMVQTLILGLVPLLATFATAAQYFNLIGLSNDEVRIPSADHLITFDISNPDADYDQGGSDYATCKLEWDSEFPPTCWTTCNSTGPAWYARITPSYPYSYTNFSLDIQEFYETVDAPVLNNVSVAIESGE